MGTYERGDGPAERMQKQWVTIADVLLLDDTTPAFYSGLTEDPEGPGLDPEDITLVRMLLNWTVTTEAGLDLTGLSPVVNPVLSMGILLTDSDTDLATAAGGAPLSPLDGITNDKKWLMWRSWPLPRRNYTAANLDLSVFGNMTLLGFMDFKFPGSGTRVDSDHTMYLAWALTDQIGQPVIPAGDNLLLHLNMRMLVFTS